MSTDAIPSPAISALPSTTPGLLAVLSAAHDLGLYVMVHVDGWQPYPMWALVKDDGAVTATVPSFHELDFLHRRVGWVTDPAQEGRGHLREVDPAEAIGHLVEAGTLPPVEQFTTVDPPPGEEVERDLYWISWGVEGLDCLHLLCPVHQVAALERRINRDGERLFHRSGDDA